MAKQLTRKEGIIPFVCAALWFTGLWFGFIAVNVNQMLGVNYLSVFTIMSMILYTWDKIKTVPLDRTGKWFMPLVQAVVLYAGFVLLASISVGYFKNIPFDKLISLIATTTPALAQSQILNTITFVIFVPFAETIFFVYSMDFLASTGLNINLKKFTLPTI